MRQSLCNVATYVRIDVKLECVKMHIKVVPFFLLFLSLTYGLLDISKVFLIDTLFSH